MNTNYTCAQYHLNAWLPAKQTRSFLVHCKIFLPHKEPSEKSLDKELKPQQVSPALRKVIHFDISGLHYLTEWEKTAHSPLSFRTANYWEVFSPCLKKDLSDFLKPKEIVRIWLTELPTLLTVTLPQNSSKLLQCLDWSLGEYSDLTVNI